MIQINIRYKPLVLIPHTPVARFVRDLEMEEAKALVYRALTKASYYGLVGDHNKLESVETT